MTQPDPRAARADTRAALSDPEYVAAFDTLMRGGSTALPPERVAAVHRAQTLTGTAPPGLPQPWRAEPGAQEEQTDA